MRRERMVLMLISLLSLLLPQSALAAQAVDCVMVQEDVGNGYRYEAPGIGGFSINGQNGETLSAAVISLDPGLEVQILRDGYEASFSDGVILDNGSYEMRIFRKGKKMSTAYFILRCKTPTGRCWAVRQGAGPDQQSQDGTGL